MEINPSLYEFKEFYGVYNKQMPLLISEGFTPQTSKDITRYRYLSMQRENQIVKDFFLRSFDTVTGLACYDGKLIIDPNSELLLNVNQNTQASIPLTKEQFDKLAKKYGIIEESRVIHGDELTRGQAKESEILYKLAGDDIKFHHDYVDAVYDLGKAIGVFLPKDINKPAMYNWTMGLVTRWAWVIAGMSLDNPEGISLLLGVQKQGLDEILKRNKSFSVEENLEYFRSLDKRILYLSSLEDFQEAAKTKKIRDEIYKQFLG